MLAEDPETIRKSEDAVWHQDLKKTMALLDKIYGIDDSVLKNFKRNAKMKFINDANVALKKMKTPCAIRLLSAKIKQCRLNP